MLKPTTVATAEVVVSGSPVSGSRSDEMECPECPECGGNERVKCKRCEKLVCSYCVEVGNHGEEGYCWECWDKLIVNDDDSYSFVDDAEASREG